MLRRIFRDRILRELLSSSGWMYAGGVLSIGLTFVQQVTTASGIGVEGYGQFAAIFGITTLVMLLADFRTWEAATKLLAQTFDAGDIPESARIVTLLLLVDVLAGMLGALVLLPFAGWIATEALHDESLAVLLQLFAFALPFRLIARGVPNTLLRLYGRFDWLSAKSVLYAIIRLVCMSGPALAGMGVPGVVVGALIAEVLHAVMFFVMAAVLWRRNSSRELSMIRLAIPARLHERVRLLRDLWIGATLKGLLLESFVPLLALLTSPQQVGLYRAGVDIGTLLQRLTDPLQIVIQPTLIQLYHQDTLTNFVRYIKRVTLLLMLLVLPFVLGLLLFGGFVLPLLFDESFDGLYPVAALLVIGYGLSAVGAWLRPAVVALNLLQAQNVIGVVTLVLSLTGLVVLSSHGAVGAALVMCGFLVSHNGLTLFVCLRQIRRQRSAQAPV